MELPIACSLDATQALGQLGEWKELFSRTVTGTFRAAPVDSKGSLVANYMTTALAQLA